MMDELIPKMGWVIPTAIIAGVTLLLHLLISRIYKHAYPRIERSRLAWDSSLLKALTRPLKIFIWVMATTLEIQVLSYHFESESLAEFFPHVRNFFFIAIFFWFSLRFIKNMEQDYSRTHKKRKQKYDKTTIRAICQISRIVVFLIAVLVYLQSRNINISAVLAFGGAGGLVVGLAAKDLLSNFFGGLMIYMDRPFSVGDWIRSPDKEIEGTVEEIGWRLTRIRTFDKRPLYVPNSLFSTVSVENPSRMSNRRIKTSIGVRYDDASKIQTINKQIKVMLWEHPEIANDQFMMVRFYHFGPSSLDCVIYTFTKTTDWGKYMEIQEDVFVKAIAIIESNGAECAFPTTTVHLPDEIQVGSWTN